MFKINCKINKEQNQIQLNKWLKDKIVKQPLLNNIEISSDSYHCQYKIVKQPKTGLSETDVNQYIEKLRNNIVKSKQYFKFYTTVQDG